MSMCIGKNNVYVIGKMIHKFCYSHLIMINTLYTCIVQVRVLYTVQYRVYYYFWARLNFIGGVGGLHTVQYRVYYYFWARLNFIGGGLHTVQYRVYHYFLLGSILFGGLKPPRPNDAPPLLTCNRILYRFV